MTSGIGPSLDAGEAVDNAVPVARYECLVHAVNRNRDYGTPVSVLASTVSEARGRAVAVGWDGRPEHAQVTILSIREVAS